MHEWLEWARGPVFRFAFLFMVLGMFRLMALNLLSLRSVARRAGNKEIPVARVLRSTVQWLLPHGGAVSRDPVFTMASVLFHIAMIFTPVFLGAHILLWQRGLGVSWPALSQPLADTLTLVGVAAGLILIVQRIFARASRELSRPQDYLLPVLITTIFASGFLAMHPAVSPFSYDATMLLHVICGNLMIVVLPFSKLSHALLFPITRLISEMAWHLAPDAGQQVAIALNKEGDPI